jgi:hypothetical protein
LDPQKSFEPRGVLKCGDAVFTIETVFDFTVAGCGDGNVIVFDNESQECLYGYGVQKKGGVRNMKITEDNTRLICTGDDETSMMLVFI